MSTQKGNIRRTRPQKHKNTIAYKNAMHDTSKRTQELNNMTMSALCARCKGILEWKVRYKKYKPLTQPTTCLKCNQKTVKRAYYTICMPCIESLGVCGKCGLKAELVIPPNEKSQEQINAEFESELKKLRERERRTLLRCAAKGTDSAVHKSDEGSSGDCESDDSSDEDHPGAELSDSSAVDAQAERLSEVRVDRTDTEEKENEESTHGSAS